MVNNVLILGAGASKHYDFPLAYEIVQRVRQNVDSMQQHASHFDIELADYDRVVTRLLSSGCTSIDQFAEYLDSAEDIRIAKALIAFHLGIFETRAALSSKWAGGHWYELLANHLIGPKLGTFPQRDIAIITFNYERSLEQYLLDCLTSRFEQRHSEADIRAAFLRLPIIHIYGRMGQLPGFAKSGTQERAYEPISGPLEMNAAINGMHILRELRDDPGRGERDAARQHLRDAKGIVTFLGFAYAEENLEALDLVTSASGKTAVYGTIWGIGEGDERHKELTMRLRRFNVSLSEPWRFNVYDAILKRPLTILGAPR
jgi:hypothetical protein